MVLKERIYKYKALKYLRKYKTYLSKYERTSNEKKELSLDRLKEKKYHESVIKTKAIFSVICGILLLAIIIVLDIAYGDDGKNVVSTIINILSTLISIVIGLGVGSFVLDFFGYVQYTKDRIKEVMLEKQYINTLSTEEKRKMILAIEHSLYFKDGTIPDNSLYANIKQQIIPLIEYTYFQKYKVHIDCYVDEDKGKIIKKIHKTMEIVSHSEGKSFKWPFVVRLTRNEKEDSTDDIYDIGKCIFNSNDITKEVYDKKDEKEIDSLENPNDENVQIKINYEFVLKKGVNYLEVITESRVPIDDNTFSHSVTIPCKEYEIDFDIHNNDYDVIGFAFALDSGNAANEIEQVVDKKKFDRSYRITINDWVLPGEGCVFVIKKT